MLVVFLIPHSLLGSEFDYSQLESEGQSIKTNLDDEQAERRHFFMNKSGKLNWIIHESRLLQMRGARHEGVVLHCECLVTKQIQ